MEGKTVIMTVLLLSLVMGQIQVEAKSCCPSTTARNIYNVCRFGGGSRPVCAATSGCKNVNGKCSPGYPYDILENTGATAINEEYCKLGCASSVSSAITTLQNFGNANLGEEVVKDAVEQCTKACSAFCTKRSITALETA